MHRNTLTKIEEVRPFPDLEDRIHVDLAKALGCLADSSADVWSIYEVRRRKNKMNV